MINQITSNTRAIFKLDRCPLENLSRFLKTIKKPMKIITTPSKKISRQINGLIISTIKLPNIMNSIPLSAPISGGVTGSVWVDVESSSEFLVPDFMSECLFPFLFLFLNSLSGLLHVKQ